MREKYDGYKSTFGQVPEPPRGANGKGWFFLCLICGILAAACFGSVGVSVYAKHRAAQIVAAQALAQSQAAAMKRRMTVFPEPPHNREVHGKMADYIASGFGESGCNGTYADQLDGTYKLDATHWLAVDGNGNWALAANSAPGLADDYYVSTATSGDTPDSGTWSGVNSGSPIGTVTAVVADTTPPVYDSDTGASVPTTGDKVNVPLIEEDSPPVLPATGVTGFTVKVNGVERTITGATASSTTVSITIANKIYSTDKVTVKYDGASGNVTDSAGTPNEMASFGPVAVDNNSTQTRGAAKRPIVMENGQLKQLPEGEELNISSGADAGATINAVATLTDGETITWEVGNNAIEKAVVTLGGDRTLAISGAASGQQGILLVKQDGTGGRTLTLPAGSKVVNDGGGEVTLSSTANAIDALAFLHDGTSYYWTKGLSFS